MQSNTEWCLKKTAPESMRPETGGRVQHNNFQHNNDPQPGQ